MHDFVSVAASQYGNIIDTARCVRKQIRNFDAALAVPRESSFRAEQQGILPDLLIFGFLERSRTWLPVKSVEERLGIECFNLAGATRHEQKDD